jgi:hypothetical protein
MAVISAVVLIFVTETGILALLLGSLTGVLEASSDLGTNKGGCGIESLMALDMENLSSKRSRKTVKAGLLSQIPQESSVKYKLEFRENKI